MCSSSLVVLQHPCAGHSIISLLLMKNLRLRVFTANSSKLRYTHTDTYTHTHTDPKIKEALLKYMQSVVRTMKIMCSLPFQTCLAGETFMYNIIQDKREPHWGSFEGEISQGRKGKESRKSSPTRWSEWSGEVMWFMCSTLQEVLCVHDHLLFF